MSTSLKASADVVVIGAGIVGCSAAYHLRMAGAGSVLVLDRLAGPGQGSTGACAGGFRHQFSSDVNIRLSLASTPMITAFSAEHGIDVDVTQDGYLFLVRDDDVWKDYLATTDLQRSMGVPTELLAASEVAAIMPGLAAGDLVGATFCPIDGIADPGALTQGYATIAARAGAVFAYDVDVHDLRTREGRVAGVRTAGGNVTAGSVILATGAWTAELAATAGIRVPIEPVPRTIVTTGPFPGVPERRTLVIDAGSTCYFHREGDGVLLGMAGNDEVTFDTAVDDSWIAESLLPRAVAVFPPLADAGLRSRWAGLYEMTPDRHPVIGPAGPGLWIAAGFSGHGFQHGPVVGKLLAEMVVDGAARTVDVDALGLDRFGSGDLVAEGRVV